MTRRVRMKKLLLLRLVIFLFLFVITFVTYNSSNGYGANEKDVLEINKIVQSGFDEARKGNLDAAIGYFNKAISLDEKNSHAYLGLGNAYSQKGDTDNAIGYFNKAISLDEKNSHAYVGLGNAYSRKGDADKAIGYFNKAISLDEKNHYAYYNLGLLYLSLNKKESALEKHKILENLNKDLADQLYKQIQLRSDSKK
jgi:superkiller protein 3